MIYIETLYEMPVKRRVRHSIDDKLKAIRLIDYGETLEHVMETLVAKRTTITEEQVRQSFVKAIPRPVAE